VESEVGERRVLGRSDFRTCEYKRPHIKQPCSPRPSQTAPQKDIVLSRQGDWLFEQGRFIPAAQCYAKSSRSFEFVALRFVDANERDALRIYLSERLDLLDKKVRSVRDNPIRDSRLPRTGHNA
jgi:hypothetical protein